MKSISIGYFVDTIFFVSLLNTKSELTAVLCLSWIIVRLFSISSKFLDQMNIESFKSIKTTLILQLIFVLVLIGIAVLAFYYTNSKFHFFSI